MAEGEEKREDGNVSLDLKPGAPQRIPAWGLVVGTDVQVKLILGHNALMDKMLGIQVKGGNTKEENAKEEVEIKT